MDEENYKDFDALAEFGHMNNMPKLENITLESLMKYIERNNHLAKIVKNTKNIDKDNNGYVLSSELTKIFKTYYTRELEGKTLKKILRPFSSIQNK